MGKVLRNNLSDYSLEQKTEEELWLEYHQKRDPKIREVFIKQYAPLVKYVAGKVAVGMPHNVEFDDLVGFGVFGLLDAIDKFDPAKNVKFKTYAVTRIRGAIFDELRSIDWVPRSVRQKTREIEDAIGSLEAQLGRTATDQEIANSLGIDEGEFLKTMMKISGTSILSLNDVWFSGDENDKVSIGDSIEAPMSLNPDVIVEKDEIRRVIVNAISELPEKEKKILVLYYYEDLTLKEIGQVLEVTESRVSQLHTKAILRLRAKLTNIRKGIV
ncbi:MAG: RNA polymerase sigma factor WhiG [Spirochaetaceae bacterium]|jgi:RNA polymerase sigma factor for flagellar operon FliA|nr:RNA polymerase sigma factor WhiG [Spirochaetaceae bacterium]